MGDVPKWLSAEFLEVSEVGVVESVFKDLSDGRQKVVETRMAFDACSASATPGSRE